MAVEIKHGMPVIRKMTPEDFRKAAGGGVNFGKDGRYISEIFTRSFLEWKGKGVFLKNAEIDRLYYGKMEPLMLSPEGNDQKKKIIKKIFEKWPDCKKVIRRDENGKISRMIEGVGIKEKLQDPLICLYNYDLEIKENKRLIKEKKKEEKKRLRELLNPKPEKKKTPYEIHGPCPGEKEWFSAFDYLRKRPLRGWDTPEKRAWFEKIMGEIIKK